MGRDKVLGLSLAILLIGFAGAFCFRNEQFVEKGLKLARAHVLDAGISQRIGPKPYVADAKPTLEPAAKPTVMLQGIEAIETVESPPPSQKRKRENSPVITSQPRLPANVARAEPLANDHLAAVESVRTTPASEPDADKPLEMAIRPNTPAFNPPDSLLEDSAKWQHDPDARDGCPALTGVESEPSPVASSTTYRVRRGDTLTKIAQHFLGDAGRYHEIFEANRDRLQTPSTRLKVGMVLQIPDAPRSKRSSTAATAKPRSGRSNGMTDGSTSSRSTPVRPVARTRELPKSRPATNDTAPSSPADDAQESTGKPRFVPVPRAPFLQSRGESASNARGRSLSQRPPTKESSKSSSDHDRETDRKVDSDESDTSRTRSTRQEGENSTMDSGGSEGT
jgi:nucleoid-associated protein YgaU